jgi:hypothetical protein
MTKQNAHTTSATENEIFAARLRTFADLVEQNKITSAVVYAVVDGLSPTAEFNSPLHPDVFAGQFCNCSEEDYSGFLDDMYTWVRSVLRNREARKAVAPAMMLAVMTRWTSTSTTRCGASARSSRGLKSFQINRARK